MKNIKQAIKEAHKSADKAIAKAQKSVRWAKLNDWLNPKYVFGCIGVTVVACMLF